MDSSINNSMSTHYIYIYIYNIYIYIYIYTYWTTLWVIRRLWGGGGVHVDLPLRLLPTCFETSHWNPVGQTLISPCSNHIIGLTLHSLGLTLDLHWLHIELTLHSHSWTCIGFIVLTHIGFRLHSHCRARIELAHTYSITLLDSQWIHLVDSHWPHIGLTQSNSHWTHTYSHCWIFSGLTLSTRAGLTLDTRLSSHWIHMGLTFGWDWTDIGPTLDSHWFQLGLHWIPIGFTLDSQK